jgi:hypothetical protein
MVTLISFYTYLVLLVVCVVTGFYCIRGLKKTILYIKLLPWFLLFTLITEMLALFWAINVGRNHCVYNVYILFQSGFFGYMLHRMIENNRIMKLLACISIAYVVLTLLSDLLILGIRQFNAISFVASGIYLSFFSGYSLNELFKKAITVSPFKTPEFWIAGSILVLNSCLIPLILPAALGLDFTKGEARLITFLIALVNFIAYPMLIVAFLCQYRNNKTTSL